MDIKKVFERECDGCRFCKPGRKSDCQIRLALYYDIPVSEVFKTWANGQVFGGYCKQRKVK